MRLIRKRDLWWKFKDAMIIIAFFILIVMAVTLIISVPFITVTLLQNLLQNLF